MMERPKAENYELLFGSNRILNCGSVVRLEGRGVKQEFIRLREGRDGKLLVTIKVRDKEDRTTVVVNNGRVAHVAKGLEVETLPSGLVIRDTASRQVILELQDLGGRKLKVNGVFWVAGRRIVATDEGLQIDGVRLARNTIDSCGAAIGIG